VRRIARAGGAAPPGRAGTTASPQRAADDIAGGEPAVVERRPVRLEHPPVGRQQAGELEGRVEDRAEAALAALERPLALALLLLVGDDRDEQHEGERVVEQHRHGHAVQQRARDVRRQRPSPGERRERGDDAHGEPAAPAGIARRRRPERHPDERSGRRAAERRSSPMPPTWSAHRATSAAVSAPPIAPPNAAAAITIIALASNEMSSAMWIGSTIAAIAARAKSTPLASAPAQRGCPSRWVSSRL